MSENSNALIGIAALAAIGIIVLGIIFIGYPVYNVWASEKHGQAELAQGEYNRQLAVVELPTESQLPILEATRGMNAAKSAA